MAYYHERRAESGITSDGGGFCRAGIVTMCGSDFICDVETSARRGLTSTELKFFRSVYINQDASYITRMTSALGDEKFNSIKKHVQLKLGSVFKTRGVFPVSEYIRSVDVR